MGLVFIDGKNNDYPCFLELRDLWNANISSPPYSTGLLVVGGDYPHYSYLKAFPEKVDAMVYPVSVFQCLGLNFNNGYPVKQYLNDIKLQTYSKLYINDINSTELHLNGLFISSAFCREQDVFSIRYQSN